MKKRLAKLITLMLALVMIIGAVAGLNVFAEGVEEEEVQPTNVPTLDYANVVYDEEIKLAFTVGNADGEKAGIIVYASAESDEIAYRSYEAKEKDGVIYYETFGIAAKDIDTEYSVAAVYTDANGNEVVGARINYSVKAYAQSRLATDGISDAQANLYEKILAYNAAANAIFDN